MVGVAVFLRIALNGLLIVWLLPALPVVQILVALVQWRMHEVMGIRNGLEGWLPGQGI